MSLIFVLNVVLEVFLEVAIKVVLKVVLREAFKRKNRKYIGLLPIRGTPPPKRGDWKFPVFSSALFFLFFETLNYDQRAMKQILYDTVCQIMVNRDVCSHNNSKLVAN